MRPVIRADAATALVCVCSEWLSEHRVPEDTRKEIQVSEDGGGLEAGPQTLCASPARGLGHWLGARRCG